MEERELVLKRAKNAVISRDFSLALRIYNSLLKDDPDNKEYLSAIGNIYEKTNSDAQALGYFQRILQKYPNDFEALNHMGGILRRLKMYDQAILVLQKALSTGKNSSEVNYNLGFTYKLVGKIDEAISCFESVISENPSDVLAYNQLGTIYYQLGDYQKSIQTYKMGLQIDSNHPILQYNLARSYEALENYQDALSSYETAMRAKPGWIDAIKDYSWLLVKLNRSKNALENVNKALELHPKDESLLLLEGRIYFYQTNFAKAEEIVENLSLYSKNWKTFLLLARIFHIEGKVSEAEEAINKANAFDGKGDNFEIIKEEIRILLSENKFQSAREKVPKIDSKNYVHILELQGEYSICTGSEGNLDQIRSKIIGADKDYSDFYTIWGLRFFQKGKFSEAKKYFKKQIELNRKSILAWLLLGLADEKLNYFESAKEDYMMVLNIDPEIYLAKQKLSSLQNQNQNSGFESIVENETTLKDVVPEVPDFFEELNEKNREENSESEKTPDSENKAEHNDEKSNEESSEVNEPKQDEKTEDEKTLEKVSSDEDANIFSLDDSVTTSDQDKSLSEKLLEGEELSDFDTEPPEPEEEEPEEEDEDEEEENDKEVFINIPSELPQNSSENNGNNTKDEPEKNLKNESEKASENNDSSLNQNQNPAATLSEESEKKINDALERAKNAAEKAWQAAQNAADAASAVDKAGDYIDKMTEDATKKLQDEAENLQNKIKNQQNEENPSISEEEPILDNEEKATEETEPVLPSETDSKEISDSSISENSISNSGNVSISDGNADESLGQRRASDIQNQNANTSAAYQKLLYQVSRALPIVENMLVNKETPIRFKKEIELFTNLRNLGDFLPEEQKSEFESSKMRVLLDFLIAKLSGKPGLLKTTDSLRRSGIFENADESLPENASPEYDGLSENELAKKVLKDMQEMTKSLKDKSLAEGLDKIAQETEEKLDE